MKSSFLLLTLAAAPLWSQPLSRGDRDFAMSNLHATRRMLLDAVSGLTPAQWSFKPGPDRWSIREILEHLVRSEDSMFHWSQETLKSPAVAPHGDRAQDERCLARMADRSQKAQAPAPDRPTGGWSSPAELIQEFNQRRDRTIRYVETTQDALRSHRTGPGENSYDAYQILLLISGHTQRHVAQIDEVKADPHYPR
jgi:uncharacterized damage-inducible protein DinB